MNEGRPSFWQRHKGQVRDSALNTGFVLLISLILSVFLAFAEGPGSKNPLVSMLGNGLQGIRDQAFDAVNFVQSGMTMSSNTEQKVFLIDLDDQAVQDAEKTVAAGQNCAFQDVLKCQSRNMVYFSRDGLATVLENLNRFPERPQGVFIDLDLSYPDPYTSGERLARALKDARYPVFLPFQRGREDTQQFVLDGRLYAKADFPNLCFVNHHLQLDEGSYQVRQLAPGKTGHLSVAEALYHVGQGHQVTTGGQVCNQGGEQVPIEQPEVGALVYKTLDRDQELQHWDGLEVRKGLEIIQHPTDQHIFDRGVVLIGRTDANNGDNYYTPISPYLKRPTSGVEVHVTSLMNLIHFNHFGQSLSGITVLLVSALVLFLLQLGATLLVDSALKLKDLLGDFLEIVLVWLLLLVPAALVMHHTGYFLDYSLSLVALYLFRTFLKLKTDPEPGGPTPQREAEPTPQPPVSPEEAR